MFEDEFDADLKKITADAKQLAARAQEILDMGGQMKVKDRRDLADTLAKLQQDLE